MRPISHKRQRRDRVYAQRRRQVHDRADGRCEAPVHDMQCSGQCEQVHHIAGRGGPNPHRLDNLIGLSSACHRLAHDRPAAAREWGVSVSRNGGAA